MTESTNPSPAGEPTPDETFTWTGEPGNEHGAHGAPGAAGSASSAGTGATSATAILDSIREAVDDLADRATPTVREFSARAAEFAAVAADRAAPLAKRAGEVTSEASGKLALKSRIWAADIRASLATDGDATDPAAPSPAATDATPPPAAPTDGPTPA
jgi:hypothetical protein